MKRRILMMAALGLGLLWIGEPRIWSQKDAKGKDAPKDTKDKDKADKDKDRAESKIGTTPPKAKKDREKQALIDKATDRIKELKGKYKVDEKSPLKPVLMVDLSHTKAKDADLELLKVLIYVEELKLGSTRVTNTGLKHLKLMTNLQTLDLQRNAIDDSGLAHLKDLKDLQFLNLEDTQVSDAGLNELKGLSILGTLNLRSTKVTDPGVEKLKISLPQVNVLN